MTISGDTSEKVDVTVLIPAYNEEKAIAKVIADARDAMKSTSYSFEILVVDDGSKDRTAQEAEKAGVRVLKHPENRGSGASRRTGIAASRGEWIVMTDADGTYPAHMIPPILEELKTHHQVIGARTEEKGTHKLLRTFAKEFIRRLASLLTGRKIPDLNSGLRAFRRTDMMRFLYLVPDGFSCVSTMTLSFLTNGLLVKFVPIPYYKRIGDSKFHPVKDTYNYLLTVIRITSYFAPLKVFMPACLVLVFAGVVKGFLDFVVTSSIQESDIILVLTGMIVGSMGILADLIVVQGKKNHAETGQGIVCSSGSGSDSAYIEHGGSEST